MSHFMVEIELSGSFTQPFINKIPQQRQVINELMTQQKIASYSLSEDRTRLWVVVMANDEYQVMDILSKFPLVDYMKPKIFELMFHNAAIFNVPSFSLN